ncbi:MAG TPA: clostripain-related cysteine peptidase [Pyrinomonadaceae bacterium]|nr:clostripain-related cysteine peptidase [Pyrinomonadaceae bacterium]
MKQKEWTIMIYMAGDNNLAVDMAYAMEQIKSVAEAGDSSPNLFVYYDGNSPAIPTLYCDFSEPGKPRYVRSYSVPNKLYSVTPKHNENAADKRAILNFVDWCIHKVEVEDDNGEISFGRKADKYALIFSGHSLGFQDIGLFKDESSGKSMNMKDFHAALKAVVNPKDVLEQHVHEIETDLDDETRRSETTELLGQKLDILGFDSCVMGMLEVGYQFSSVAKAMIASEGSVPSAGWTYAKILGCLAQEQNRNLDTRKVAELFVKRFIRTQDEYTVGGVSVDMAAWDLSRFDELAAAFDALSIILLACFDDPKSRIYRQMERVILQVHWKCQSYMYDQNVDLGDFCELLDRECGRVLKELGSGDDLERLKVVQDSCRSVLEELNNAVILSGFSGGGYQYSNGVSVFFPWSREAYEVSKKNYESLWFAKEAKRKLSWAGFLRKYLNEISRRKFEPPVENIPVGARYRYNSGVPLDERPARALTGSNGNSRSKIAGQEGSKIAGQEGSKIAGQEGSKIAGQEGSKIAGQEGSKIAGQEGSKIAGQEGSKIAGQEGSKIAGQEGSKLAGGGSSAFFNSLRLFKNVESRWDVSGFTRKPIEMHRDDD